MSNKSNLIEGLRDYEKILRNITHGAYPLMSAAAILYGESVLKDIENHLKGMKSSFDFQLSGMMMAIDAYNRLVSMGAVDKDIVYSIGAPDGSLRKGDFGLMGSKIYVFDGVSRWRSIDHGNSSDNENPEAGKPVP